MSEVVTRAVLNMSDRPEYLRPAVVELLDTAHFYNGEFTLEKFAAGEGYSFIFGDFVPEPRKSRD